MSVTELSSTIHHWVEVAQTITVDQIIQQIVEFPHNYKVWWQNLLHDSPQHVIIETSLILFIIWLLFIRRTVDPKKTSKTEKLSNKEVEWLLSSWKPDPLVPAMTETQEAIVDNITIIEGVQNDYVKVRGVKNLVLNAASFDFLGFGLDPEITATVKKTLDFYGCGSCGPRGFYGTIDQHLILEDKLAKFMGVQEAICYSDGSSAISSAIPAFSKKGDLLIVDDACCEPVMSGVNLSRSTVRYFKHNDMEDLKAILEAVRKEDIKLRRDTSQQRRFIVVEGVYRNVGDICPLPEIIKLKEKYFYRLIMDETLSFGTTGNTGRGLTEHFGIPIDSVEVITFTLDTVLSSVGGVCVGTREIVDHQRLSGAGYCFSASSAPFLCAAAIESLHQLESNPELVSMLSETSKELHRELSKLPYVKPASDVPTAVVQLVFKEPGEIEEDGLLMLKIARECVKKGVGVVANKFNILKGSADGLQPSLMVCANIALDEKKIANICKTISSVLKTVMK